MEPFRYDKKISGKYFVGRQQECSLLVSYLEQMQNVAIYDAPKTGKSSLIKQSLQLLSNKGCEITICRIDLLSLHCVKDFVNVYVNSLLDALAATKDDKTNVVNRYLSETAFDESTLSYDAESVQDADLERVLAFPTQVSKDLGAKFCMILNNFHRLMEIEGGEKIIKFMERHEASKIGIFKEENPCFCYIFESSFQNAMKNIFEKKKFFYNTVKQLSLSKIEEKDVTEHIVRGFLETGKVIERDLVHQPYMIFNGNMWYLNHMASICGSKAIGYINATIIQNAIEAIISLHSPLYQRIIGDLTDYQIVFVRAILDGVTKFSASEVIREYGFNSSANVKRLKDALIKKEVVSFDSNDYPHFQDPLFEYWLRNYYFI